MLRRFGGLEGFCAEWVRHIREAMTGKRSISAALRSFQAIARVIELASKQDRKFGPPVSRLSDKQLEQEHQLWQQLIETKVSQSDPNSST